MDVRCEFEHIEFAQNGAFRHDASNQCWMTETANFGAESEPRHYCIFHAPPKREPIGIASWPLASRGSMQSRMFKKLLKQWRDVCNTRQKRGQKAKAFLMPGMHCGSVILTGFTFPAALMVPDSRFNGLTDISNAIFRKTANFKRVIFRESIDFRKTVFGLTADFDSAEFNGSAFFSKAAFNGDADFDRANFRGSASFNEAVFHGAIFRYNLNYTGASALTNATFDKKVVF